MKNKKILFLLGVINVICVSAYARTVLDGKFDDFIKEVVAAEDQKQFRSFYNDLVQKQKKEIQSTKGKSRKKRRDYASNLRKLGSSSLEVRKPELAMQLKPYPSKKGANPEQEKKVNDFLFRYGAYEEFLKDRAAKQNSMFAKTRTYIRDAGNKMVSWFNGLRRPKPNA